MTEMRRPGRGKIRSGGYIYWPGLSNGTSVLGLVAIGIFSQLHQFVMYNASEAVTHFGLYVSCCFVSRFEMWKTKLKVFNAELDSILDQCSLEMHSLMWVILKSPSHVSVIKTADG